MPATGPWGEAEVAAGDQNVPGERMLEAVGLTISDELVYRTLLDNPQATLAELAGCAGLSAAQARRALSALAGAGLVSRGAGAPARFVPARPDVAVEALVLRRQEELERARLQAATLLEQFQRSQRRRTDRQVVELLTGRDAIVQRSAQVVSSAREEVLIFDKPPYLGPLDNPMEYASLARGVRWRAVYAPESLELPERMSDLRRLATAGEQARIGSRVPLKLVVADRRLALLPLTIDQDDADRTAIVVASSSLLDTIIMLFDLVWERSVPVPGGGAGTAGPATGTAGSASGAAGSGSGAAGGTGGQAPDAELLALLAAGIKDEVMARQLGLSIRTVRRRIAALIHAHGVQTRFQLGLIAGRRGWI